MIPGEMIHRARRDRAQRRPRDRHAEGREQRRPADPGRLALPLLRDQRRARVRPRRGPRLPPQHPRRHRGALRAGPGAHGGTGRARRRARGVRLPGQGHGQTEGRREMSLSIGRQAYAEMFGPTTGDRVRLADTELWIEVEKDFTHLRRRSEIRRRQGDPRRHGPEPARVAESAPTPSSPTR